MSLPVRITALLAMVFMVACTQAPQTPPDTSGAEPEPPAEATIVGKVTRLDRVDASGIQVFIPGTSMMAFTDEMGGFRIGKLGDGVYTLRAQSEGYNPVVLGEVSVSAADFDTEYRTEPTILTPTTTTVAVLHRVSLGQIAGRVSTELPEAALDMTKCVVELKGTIYRTVCDAQGGFQLWNLPADNYTLAAWMPGAVRVEQPVRVLPDATVGDVAITLPVDPAFISREVRGLVRLTGGDGINRTDFERVVVTLRKPDNTQATATLANDGTFRFPSLQPGVYTVSASASGYVDATAVEADLSELPEADIQLSLRSLETQSAEETGRISGIAMKNSLDGDPGGVRVGLTGTSFASITGLDGAYSLERIPPGEYTLIAMADGFETKYVGPFEVLAGDELEVEGIILDPKFDRPRVLSISPGDGAVNVVVRDEIPVTVRFSKKMDPESLRNAITIQPAVDFAVYTGKDRADTDFDLAKIVLTGSGEGATARFGTRYTVRIADSASDIEGVSMEEAFQASFETGKASVIGSRPVDGGTLGGSGVRESLIVYFNAPIDPASISGSELRIRPRLDADPQVSMDRDPKSGWTRMFVRANWQPGTEYSMSIGRRTRTTSRETLSNTPYRIEFRTPEARIFDQPTTPESVR